MAQLTVENVLKGTAPSHDFSEPLQLMRDCHRRVEKFLDQLLDVSQQAWGEELSEAQRAAFDTALRYFRTGAPLHTRDEEDSLFPRLRAVRSPLAAQALATVEALEADHEVAEAAHAEVERLGRKWLDEKVLSESDAHHLLCVLRRLRAAYERHIAIEDNEVFPIAAEVLSVAAIEAIGREMAARRGVDFDQPSEWSRCAQRRLTRERVV